MTQWRIMDRRSKKLFQLQGSTIENVFFATVILLDNSRSFNLTKIKGQFIGDKEMYFCKS